MVNTTVHLTIAKKLPPSYDSVELLYPVSAEVLVSWSGKNLPGFHCLCWSRGVTVCDGDTASVRRPPWLCSTIERSANFLGERLARWNPRARAGPTYFARNGKWRSLWRLTDRSRHRSVTSRESVHRQTDRRPDLAHNIQATVFLSNIKLLLLVRVCSVCGLQEESDRIIAQIRIRDSCQSTFN